MITIEDCKAFCDAPSSHAEELACYECVTMVEAYARAHDMALRAADRREDETNPVREENTMMTMQAREMLPTHSDKAHPMRAYPANSPSAMARLVVLALLADGRLDECELEVLNRRGAFVALGISRDGFVKVLYDFCADVAKLSKGVDGYRLSPAVLSALLAEVNDPWAKERVLNLIVAVVSSDGQLTEGEKELFLTAADTWGVGGGRLREGLAYRCHLLPPEAYYS